MLTNGRFIAKSARILLLVFALVTLLVVPLSVQTVYADDTYKFSEGFSSTQGQNQWYYKQWNGSSYSDMTWNATNSNWQGSYTYCLIGNGWVHPNTNDPVIAWKAPRSGTVTIRGHMEHIGNHDVSDGVKTKIMKNSAQIWPSNGWQDIMSGFMADHIFQVSVSTDDYIYFHLNQNSTIDCDTTSWDPVISYTDTPKYTLDKAELVMDPTDVANLGIPLLDISFSVVPKSGGNIDWYHTYGEESEKFSGPLNDPCQTIVYKDIDPFTNPNNIDGRWWLSNMYVTAEGGLLAFCHMEWCTQDGFWALGLAYSADDGASFTKLGKIITTKIQEPDPNNGNITGVPYFIKDNYFYIYYRENPGIFGFTYGSVCVARALVSDVINAAKNGSVTTWHKYYNGAWNELGLGGNATDVFPLDVFHNYIVHGDAAYCTYNQKYVMSGYTDLHGNGIWISFSNDGLSWEQPTYIQHGSSSNISLSPYETIVNIDGQDNGVVGQNFYIYYTFSQNWTDPPNHYMKHVFRQKVTLNLATGNGGDIGYGIGVPAPTPIPTGTSWTASTGFSSVQGQNSWKYQEWNGSALVDMTWDSANSRWKGTPTYCLIGNDWQHPENNYESIREWVAPQAMMVRITGIAKKSTVGGDGVSVSIIVIGTTAWGPYDIAYNNTIGISHDVTVGVRVGDKVYFIVNKRNTIDCDSTIWNPTITKQ